MEQEAQTMAYLVLDPFVQILVRSEADDRDQGTRGSRRATRA